MTCTMCNELSYELNAKADECGDIRRELARLWLREARQGAELEEKTRELDRWVEKHKEVDQALARCRVELREALAAEVELVAKLDRADLARPRASARSHQ